MSRGTPDASSWTQHIKANAQTLKAPTVQSHASAAAATVVPAAAAVSSVVLASKVSVTVNPVKSVVAVSKVVTSKSTGK